MGRTVDKSWAIYREGVKHLACGSSTLSKVPRIEDVEPAVIVRGRGCRVWDADGNEYIDFRNGLGPVTLGYGVPEIDRAITEQLRSGIVFGHPHPLEAEVARMLKEVVPCAKGVRFLKTGGEACPTTTSPASLGPSACPGSPGLLGTQDIAISLSAQVLFPVNRSDAQKHL